MTGKTKHDLETEKSKEDCITVPRHECTPHSSPCIKSITVLYKMRSEILLESCDQVDEDYLTTGKRDYSYVNSQFDFRKVPSIQDKPEFVKCETTYSKTL